MAYTGQVQNLSWTSPSRLFATTAELLNSQPNYENEVAIAQDTKIKYRGVAAAVGGWGYADGTPIPVVPFPPAVNDGFTHVLMEFDGIEGSTTYPDTNGAGKVRPHSTLGYAGLGHVTNTGELFGPGALRLDGKTVVTSPDGVDFDFKGLDFTIRGYFFCDFPLGIGRVLMSKSEQKENGKWVFWVDRLSSGEINVGVDTIEVLDHTILVRTGDYIVDRYGEYVVDRFSAGPGSGSRVLQSTTIYSDTINPGWHNFKFTRSGPTLSLAVDGVIEDTGSIGVEVVNQLPGPITIGGYGPPVNGVYFGNPWVGVVDRLAVDIGIAR